MRNVCLQTYSNYRVSQNSLLFKKKTNFTGNNSRILRIKNARFSEYYFCINYNLLGDFQICISVPWTKSKLIKVLWSYKLMWHYKYFAILESKVKVDETYMKMSDYENSLFQYSLHSTVNLPESRLKDTNITLISFLRLFIETITPERKSFFSKITW